MYVTKYTVYVTVYCDTNYTRLSIWNENDRSDVYGKLNIYIYVYVYSILYMHIYKPIYEYTISWYFFVLFSLYEACCYEVSIMNNYCKANETYIF